MKQKLESIMKKGKIIALAGLASLAIGCGSLPPQNTTPELTNAVAEKGSMGSVFLTGKSLDDRFKEFNDLSGEQQDYLVKGLNNLSPWENVLLARYAPIDGILKRLSSFYSTDYKEFLQTILAQSILDPTAVGLTGDKGLGGLSQSSEKWARDLYNDKKLGYKFPGAEITNNTFDPSTNLILSSILLRKAAEEKVSDLDALCSLYGNGFKGVKLNENGLYATNDFGLNVVNRAKTFDSTADKLMAFSWISMNHPELSKNIEDTNLKRLVEVNKGTYDGKVAYEDMINFLNSISTNKKYSEENRKMFRDETINISNWLKNLYGK